MRENYVVTSCSRCGVEWDIYKYNLKKKKTTMCSRCVADDRVKWNSKEKHVLAYKYASMMQRCYNENIPSYKYYGGVGTYVCEEWRNSKEAFVNWCLENGYKDGLHLDKDERCIELGINPTVYSPETCMFITNTRNQQTKKDSIMLTHNGKTQNLSQWAREIGMNMKTLSARIEKFGFTVEEALTKPTGKRYGASNNKAIIQLSMDNKFISEFPTAREADRQTGISYKNISMNLRGKSKSAGGFRWKFKIENKEGLLHV